MLSVGSIFRVQAAILRYFREFLTTQHFTEIVTSKIVSSGTEGGTNLSPLNTLTGRHVWHRARSSTRNTVSRVLKGSLRLDTSIVPSLTPQAGISPSTIRWILRWVSL